MPAQILFVRDSVNNKNVVLQVDGSNQLNVKDATAQGSLATIATASAAQATATNQSTMITLLNDLDNHGSVSATAAHQVSHNTKLDTIASNQGSQATAANQATGNSSLSAIESSLAGTLTVSAAAPARSSGQIACDLSTSVDGNAHRKCAIFGSCSDNSGAVKVHISHDNITFFEDNLAHYYANYSNGHIAGHFDVNARYFKVEFMNTATYTLEYAMCD